VRSPVRSITQPLNLGNLPADVLGNIAGQSRGAAAVLAQLSTRTNTVARDAVKSFCDADVSVGEMRRVILQNLARLRSHDYTVSYYANDARPMDDVGVFSYVALGRNRGVEHIYEVAGRRGTVLNLRHHTSTFTLAVLKLVHTTDYGEWETTIDSHDEIADTILQTLQAEEAEGLVVVPTLRVLEKVLAARKGCTGPDDVARAYLEVRVRKLLASLKEPAIDDVLLPSRAWTRNRTVFVVSNALAAAGTVSALRTLMYAATLAMMTSSTPGNIRDVYTFDSLEAIRTTLSGIRLSLAQLGRRLGLKEAVDYG
jgi:hypothetical protein